MLGGLSMQTTSLIFKSVSWLFLGITMWWSWACFGPFVVGLRTTWGSAEWVRTLPLCRLNRVQTSQKRLKMNNIRNKNTLTETNIHLLFTPSENVYVLVGERGASSRHQVNTSSPACYKVTVLQTLTLLTGMCKCSCGGGLTRPSSLSSRARTPVLSV